MGQRTLTKIYTCLAEKTCSLARIVHTEATSSVQTDKLHGLHVVLLLASGWLILLRTSQSFLFCNENVLVTKHLPAYPTSTKRNCVRSCLR